MLESFTPAAQRAIERAQARARQRGGSAVEPTDLLAALGDESESRAVETSPLPLPSEIPPLELGEPALAVDLGRILDASANRAREGLRVIEDYVRFVLDDPFLTGRLKDVRHRLAEVLKALDPDLLMG